MSQRACQIPFELGEKPELCDNSKGKADSYGEATDLRQNSGHIVQLDLGVDHLVLNGAIALSFLIHLVVIKNLGLEVKIKHTELLRRISCEPVVVIGE